MKRAYWLLVAAVPLVLWVLSKGGAADERTESSSPPKPEAPPDKPPAQPVSEPKAEEAPVSVEIDAPASPSPAAEVMVAPVIDEAVEPEVASAAAEALSTESSTTTIQLLDSKDQSFDVDLLDIDIKTARVRCVQELPANEKVRLVIAFADQAITVNAQVQEAQGTDLTLKILTMKAGQKKRFEEYLAQK